MRFLFRAGMALTFLALLPLLASAGGSCGSYFGGYASHGYAHDYVRTVYYAEIVPTPVALFQFVTPAVTTTTVTQTTQSAAVGVAVPGAVTPAAAPAAQGGLISDAQIKLLAAELAKALKGDAPAAQPREAPKKDPPPAAMPKAEEGAAAPAQDNGLVLAYQAAAIAATKCMSCHTQGSEKGKVVLFNAQGQYSPSATPQKMYEEVRTDHMPDGKVAKLTAAEKDVFRLLALSNN